VTPVDAEALPPPSSITREILEYLATQWLSKEEKRKLDMRVHDSSYSYIQYNTIL
jgi:hypothetical protein